MKEMEGIVVSEAMTNTIIVEVVRRRLHPMYRKIVKKTKRFKVHCEEKDVKVGDRVSFVSTRPISKEKHYKFKKIIKK